jgi:B12-binding domain/radical SAM domain protein
MNKPTLLIRIQNYNKVSMGALLGATPEKILDQLDIIFWVSTDEFPANQLGDRTLYIHSFMLMHIPQITEEIQELRALNLNIEFLAGGPQATASPQNTAEMGFDYVFSGHGEVDFPRMLTRWLDGNLTRGIIHQSDDEIVLNDYPGYHKAIDYIPPIEITRGCNFGCMYCAVPRLCKGRLQHRSIEAILKILEGYYSIKTRRKRIKFLAPNAFGYGAYGREPNLKAIKDLLQAVKDFGVPEIQFGSFPGEVRPDFVTREVMDIVSQFAVNKTIVMGVQSGSDAMLKKMNRGHDVKQAINAISLISEYGYRPHVDFIIGNPGETPEDRIELLDFMEAMVKKYGMKIHMHAFMSIPGTAWQDFDQSPIEPDIHARLRKLAAGGHLDGWWENQIGLGRSTKKS